MNRLDEFDIILAKNDDFRKIQEQLNTALRVIVGGPIHLDCSEIFEGVYGDKCSYPTTRMIDPVKGPTSHTPTLEQTTEAVCLLSEVGIIARIGLTSECTFVIVDSHQPDLHEKVAQFLVKHKDIIMQNAGEEMGFCAESLIKDITDLLPRLPDGSLLDPDKTRRFVDVVCDILRKETGVAADSPKNVVHIASRERQSEAPPPETARDL